MVVPTIRTRLQKSFLDYGDAWVQTLKNTIEKYPRYEIAALGAPPAPHRRIRRASAQIAAD
jgi:hypothetical protein